MSTVSTKPTQIAAARIVNPPFGAARLQAVAWFVHFWLRALLLLALTTCLSLRASDGLTEYEVKSAFLFNFLKFTEWPASAFNSPESSLTIGICGNDPFGRILDDLVKGESVNGRSIVVKRSQLASDLPVCHVLFVSRSEKNRMPAVVEELAKKPVLTVGDMDRFCEMGGMINLVLSSSGTVKPEINPEAVRQAGVRVSSKLLNLPMVRLVKTGR